MVTIRFYTNVVTIFNSFNEQTQSAKLAQSKQLICDTLTPQVLYIFIELYFVSLVAYGVCCLDIILKVKKGKMFW